MRQSGVWAKQSLNSVFSQNLVFGLRTVSHTSADGIGYQYGPEGLWIIFNRLFDLEFGVRNGSNSITNPGLNSYIIGNVIHDIHDKRGLYNPNGSWSNAGITLPSGVNKYIYNNVIYNSDAGILCTGDGTYDVANNIVANTTRAGASHFWLQNEAGNTIWNLRNNLFSQDTGTVAMRYGNTISGLTTFQNNHPGKAEQNIQAQPQFIAASSSDFHLSAASPAIDAGSALNYSQWFEAAFGLPLSVDYDNRPRNVDGNNDGTARWDVGAYEFQ